MYRATQKCGEYRLLQNRPFVSKNPKLLAEQLRSAVQRVDPPPFKWFDLRYVFDIKEDYNGKEAIQA
jgi:hypothetical protein